MTNLIGISGKKGSGKSTVAELIRFLIDQKKQPDLEISDFVNGLDPEPRDDNPWEIKAFADKLKDMVCLLIGCTREQLEDPEFKETPLGEEWWVIDKPDENLFLPYTPDNWAAHGDFENNLVIITPRKLLQKLGTECGRQIIHPNTWVNALFADYVTPKWQNTGESVAKEDVSIEPGEPSKWIIPDVRFPNEIRAIKDRGGVVIKVNRDGDDDEHESEKALDDYTGWDYVIDNNGTIEGLIDQVKTMLNKFKVI